MAVWYLDNDDEITDAVARLRGTSDEQVVFVVPSGSHIATGRINFRLLAREAQAHGVAMAVASQDAQVRAMAASASVLARPTPGEAMAALERGEEAGATEAAGAEAAASGPASSADLPAVSPAVRSSGALGWRSQRLRLATVGVLVATVVGAFAVVAVLPTATVTLVPRVTAIGPLAVMISASADVSEPDAAAGLVPAAILPIPLTAGDDYPATGIESTATAARGEVVFSTGDQDFDQEIAAGTRLRTPAGIEFATTETVVLPRSDDSGEASVRAAVEALVAGEEGNVPAGAITIVPSLEDQGISVDNPEPTSGGRVLERARVTAADYDAAAVDLRNRLTGALATFLRDPANAPAGATVFTETAALGPLALEPPAEAVVGRTLDSFRLDGSAAARVLAVDEGAVDGLLRAALEAALPPGEALVPGSDGISHEAGVVEGETITFAGAAWASASPLIDPEALASRIAGLPVSEAQAILDTLGTATVNVWPGFIGDLPNDRQRIMLDVLEPSDTE